MKDETISVKVEIAGRPFPVKVKPEEEIFVNDAVNLLNEKYNEFKKQFPGKEAVDYLAMSSLMNVMEQLKEKNDNAVAVKNFDEVFTQLDASLSEALKK